METNNEPAESGFFYAPSTKATVEDLEREVLKLPQVDLKTTHVLGGGMCARTIFIPAGTVLTGARHNLDAINFITGDIVVTTDDDPIRITGVQVIASKAGTKRGGVAITDTVWTTTWRTDLTDIEAIEDEMTDESAELQTRRLALPSTTYNELEG